MKTVTWKAHYGIVGDITLRHEVAWSDSMLLFLSKNQADKVRRHLGESGDYFEGLDLPYKGEGCWLSDPT